MRPLAYQRSIGRTDEPTTPRIGEHHPVAGTVKMMRTRARRSIGVSTYTSVIVRPQSG
jgi:hypothetical protein